MGVFPTENATARPFRDTQQQEKCSKLPNEFRDLQNLADLFAISDDVERDQVENVIDDERKQELVAQVWPQMGFINQWLDSHDDEEAHLLGRLAEAACEVKLEIDR